MKTQIKEYGNSNVLVLSSDFMKFHKAEVGDWIDLDDAIIIKQEETDQNISDICAKRNQDKSIKEIREALE